MLVRAMMATPFLFSGAIPFFDLTAPVFSGRQLPWSRREVKQLSDNYSRCRFSRRSADTGHSTLSRLEIADFLANFPHSVTHRP
jgi:hypothetical protein